MKRRRPPLGSGPGADKLKVARRGFILDLTQAAQGAIIFADWDGSAIPLRSTTPWLGRDAHLLRYEDISLESPRQGLDASDFAISLNFNFDGKGRVLRNTFCFQGVGYT